MESDSLTNAEENQTPELPHRNNIPVEPAVEILVTHHHRQQQPTQQQQDETNSSEDEDEFMETRSSPPKKTRKKMGRDDISYQATETTFEDAKGQTVGGKSAFRFHFTRRRVPEGTTHEEAGAEEIQDDDEDDEDLEVDIEEEEMVGLACFPGLDSAKTQAGHIARKVLETTWKVTHFYSLPDWLQDNDFLHRYHRPPLPSFGACLRSVFAVHTETGNIWTHLLGCVAFIGVAAWFLTRPEEDVQWQEKIVMLPFFLGAIACLGLSSAFHTVHCHSPVVGKLFGKLDYVGISLLIMGSFVPWIFYGFYCRLAPKIAYISLICILGVGAIIVSLWDKFGKPSFRPVRAGIFIGMGLSAVIPGIHFWISDGLKKLFTEVSLHWMLLMAALYIGGALLYAWRIPERFFPGKCDLVFQSHQIFHMMVILAAFVHYHGVTCMVVQRLEGPSCDEISTGAADLSWMHTEF